MLELNDELAEIIGAILGDGYLYYARKKGSGLVIVGNFTEDFHYITYLIKAFRKLGTNPTTYRSKDKNAIYLSIISKKFIEELLLLGLKESPKVNLRIPKIIKNGSSNLKAAFIRGLSDTDFSISFHKGPSRKNYTYPKITAAFSDIGFVKDVQSVIEEFGIKVNRYNIKTHLDGKVYQQYSLHIYGKKNLKLWLDNINFRNEKHLSKIRFWEIFGYCPPRTTVAYRSIMLESNVYKYGQ